MLRRLSERFYSEFTSADDCCIRIISIMSAGSLDVRVVVAWKNFYFAKFLAAVSELI